MGESHLGDFAVFLGFRFPLVGNFDWCSFHALRCRFAEGMYLEVEVEVECKKIEYSVEKNGSLAESHRS